MVRNAPSDWRFDGCSHSTVASGRLGRRHHLHDPWLAVGSPRPTPGDRSPLLPKPGKDMQIVTRGGQLEIQILLRKICTRHPVHMISARCRLYLSQTLLKHRAEMQMVSSPHLPGACVRACDHSKTFCAARLCACPTEDTPD